MDLGFVAESFVPCLVCVEVIDAHPPCAIVSRPQVLFGATARMNVCWIVLHALATRLVITFHHHLHFVEKRIEVDLFKILIACLMPTNILLPSSTQRAFRDGGISPVILDVESLTACHLPESKYHDERECRLHIDSLYIDEVIVFTDALTCVFVVYVYDESKIYDVQKNMRKRVRERERENKHIGHTRKRLWYGNVNFFLIVFFFLEEKKDYVSFHKNTFTLLYPPHTHTSMSSLSLSLSLSHFCVKQPLSSSLHTLRLFTYLVLAFVLYSLSLHLTDTNPICTLC